jgi:polyphosphate kinase
MPRNFDRRVEIAFPILDPRHQLKLREILEIQLSDTAKSWQIQPDGSSSRIDRNGRPLIRSQDQMYEILRTENDLANDVI